MATIYQKKKKNESNTGLLHYVRVCVCPTELRSENVIETCFKKHWKKKKD